MPRLLGSASVGKHGGHPARQRGPVLCSTQPALPYVTPPYYHGGQWAAARARTMRGLAHATRPHPYLPALLRFGTRGCQRDWAGTPLGVAVRASRLPHRSAHTHFGFMVWAVAWAGAQHVPPCSRAHPPPLLPRQYTTCSGLRAPSGGAGTHSACPGARYMPPPLSPRLAPHRNEGLLARLGGHASGRGRAC